MLQGFSKIGVTLSRLKGSIVAAAKTATQELSNRGQQQKPGIVKREPQELIPAQYWRTIDSQPIPFIGQPPKGVSVPRYPISESRADKYYAKAGMPRGMERMVEAKTPPAPSGPFKGAPKRIDRQGMQSAKQQHFQAMTGSQESPEVSTGQVIKGVLKSFMSSLKSRGY